MINNVKIVIAEEPRFSTSRSTASRLNKTVPKIFCESENRWLISILFFIVYKTLRFLVFTKIIGFSGKYSINSTVPNPTQVVLLRKIKANGNFRLKELGKFTS